MPESQPIKFKATKKSTPQPKPVIEEPATVDPLATTAAPDESKSLQEQVEESVAKVMSEKNKQSTVSPKTEEPAVNWEEKIAAAKAEEQKKQEQPKEEQEDPNLSKAVAHLTAIMNKEEKEALKPTPAPKDEKPVVDTPASPKEDDDEFASYWDANVGDSPVTDNKEYVASPEEIKRAEAIKDKKEDDASTYISCQNGSGSELSKAFEYIKDYMSKFKNLSKEDIDANPEIKEVMQWMADLNAITDTSLNTDQQSLLLQMIDALNKHNIALQKLDKKLSISKVTSDLSANGQPKLLRGDTAMQIINSRYRGVYKIQLHNSGFWVKLMPLKNADIDAWIQEVDFERKQIGRLIGGHFYTGMNIYLKEKLADLLKMTVVETNLENWKEGTTLVDSISIHDYDTLCWAFSIMMHKDGINISTVCVNPECRFHDKYQYMDLARCAFINPDVYTEEAMQFMIAGSAPGVIRTQKDLKDYREKLLKNVRLIKFTDNDYYELKDPSLGEFIRVGMATLGKLAAKVKDGKLNNDDEEVRRYAVYHLTKMLSPWISKIVLKNGDKTVGIIDDRDAITASLETSMNDEFHVVKQIEEFITNSKVSFYSVTSLKCPKCGHQPNLLKDNLFPLDVEYILFCLCYLKLEQIGVQL